MRILIIDYISPNNHVNLYSSLIESLAHIGKVTVVAKQGYYSNIKHKWDSVELIELSICTEGKNMFARKLNALLAMIKTRKEVNRNIDNCKIVLTFDTIAFAIGRFSIKSKRLFLMHHKNIDELTNPIKKLVFRTYMNKVNHIVFENVFKTYLVQDVGVHENRVFVIPHPVYKETRTLNCEINYNCVGLSNSNDDEFIKKIIEAEKNTQFLMNNNLHIVLRSKSYQFDNGYLKVITGYLPKNEYDNYINKSNIVFVPFPQTYKYRVSGAIYDAFSNYKFVIANNVPIIKEYQEKYPEICSGIDNVEDFFIKVIELRDTKKDVLCFENFISHHSKNIMLEKYTEALKRVEFEV